MDSLARKGQASMLILVTLIAWIAAAAAKEDDLVSQLPGLPALNFKIYSGYITVDEKNGRALFYLFAEAQNGSQNKPLTLWLNGGPACSSLGFGAFIENGPFHFIKQTVDPAINPYSWNYESNMLYVEAPAGTGFSYSNTTSDDDYSDDEITALDTFNFLQGWTKKFPEYKDRNFYIAGEGYAGHYIPKLAALLVKAKDTSSLQLQGILMGNPVIQIELDSESGPLIFFLWSHGEISDDTYAAFRRECKSQETGPQIPSPACFNILKAVQDEVGSVGLGNILGDTCADHGTPHFGRILARLKLRTRATLSSSRVKPQVPDPCDILKMIPYFNRKDVQAALHARLLDGSQPWYPCSDLDYNVTYEKMQPVLQYLVENSVRVWIYSGDQDATVPFTATRTLVNALAKELGWTTSFYHNWFVDNQIGGWSVRYSKNLLYATVRGAGHIVSRDQPERGLKLFSSFLEGTDLA